MNNRASISYGNVISFPNQTSFFKKLLAFTGPGYLIAVGYMDPGNWATGLAAGAKFGYKLLSIILISNLMATLLQYLSIKLGIVTKLDLAQACNKFYSKPTSFILWILAEISIIACDLAEVIGSAIGLNLLFNIPLFAGVIITSFDVLILLALQNKSFKYLEYLVMFLIAAVLICFGINLFISQPDIVQIFEGFWPRSEIVINHDMLYISAGILGATVMPHNLYLHSSIVQSRNYEQTNEGKKEAIKFATIDSTIALFLAFIINCSILIVAAAVFNLNGYFNVCEIQNAYYLLEPLLGIKSASIIFAISLLISGQNSTITGTLAGQIIMEGFIDIKLKPWLRRLLSRGLTILPAALTIIFFGEGSLAQLLIFSQIILSMQLSFAVFPLVKFTSSQQIMGEFANSGASKILAYAIATLIAALNIWLVYIILMT